MTFSVATKLLILTLFFQSDKLRTVEAALSIAEEFLNIPNLLSAEAVIQGNAFFTALPIMRTLNICYYIGREQKALLLYLAMFQQKLAERKKADNPLATAQNIALEMKEQLQKKLDSVRSLKAQFEEELLRLAALSSKDEFDAEKQFYIQRVESMDKMLEETRLLVHKLEQRNEFQKQQNLILQEKISALERMLEYERTARRKLEMELQIIEKLRALGPLVNEEQDIMEYYNKHKDVIDMIRMKKAAAANASKPARRDTIAAGMATGTGFSLLSPSPSMSSSAPGSK